MASAGAWIKVTVSESTYYTKDQSSDLLSSGVREPRVHRTSLLGCLVLVLSYVSVCSQHILSLFISVYSVSYAFHPSPCSWVLFLSYNVSHIKGRRSWRWERFCNFILIFLIAWRSGISWGNKPIWSLFCSQDLVKCVRQSFSIKCKLIEEE